MKNSVKSRRSKGLPVWVIDITSRDLRPELQFVDKATDFHDNSIWHPKKQVFESHRPAGDSKRIRLVWKND